MTINIDYILQQFRFDIEKAVETAIEERMNEEKIKLSDSIDEMNSLKFRMGDLATKLDDCELEASSISRSLTALDLPWE